MIEKERKTGGKERDLYKRQAKDHERVRFKGESVSVTNFLKYGEEGGEGLKRREKLFR